MVRKSAGAGATEEVFVDDLLGTLNKAVRYQIIATGKPLALEDLWFLHATIKEAARLIDPEYAVFRDRHSHRNTDTGRYYPHSVPAPSTGWFHAARAVRKFDRRSNRLAVAAPVGTCAAAAPGSGC
jgi:hypothetical protein